MPMHETGLGLLRSPDRRVLRTGTQLVQVTPELRAFLMEPKLLIVTKSAVRSKVHRRTHMDYIGIKRFDAAGKLVGEFRIVGLFTSTVYTRSTRTIPYLRRKVDAVIRRAGFDPDGHSGKALANVLETYSRDELFQIDEDTLYQFAMLILQLDERPRVRVLSRPRPLRPLRLGVRVRAARPLQQRGARRDRRSISPRSIRAASAPTIRSSRKGRWCASTSSSAATTGETPRPDRAALEETVGAIIRTWTDGLSDALAVVHDPGRARELFERYRDAFSEGYRAQLFAAGRRRRHQGDRGPVGGAAAERRLPPPHRDRRRRHRPQGVELRPSDPAVGARAGPGEHGLPRGGRADPPHPARRRRPARRLAARHGAGARRRRRGRPARFQAAAGSLLPRGDDRRRRERRLQRAGAVGRARLARRRADPHDLALPAPDPRALFAGLHVGDADAGTPQLAAQVVQLFHVRFDPRLEAMPDARSTRAGRDRRRHRAGAGGGRRASTRTASCATSSTRCSRRCAPISTRSTSTAGRRRRSRSSSRAASSTACRCRSRSTRSSSIRRGSRACTCASARSRAAASAGRTGRRISAPKSSAW